MRIGSNQRSHNDVQKFSITLHRPDATPTGSERATRPNSFSTRNATTPRRCMRASQAGRARIHKPRMTPRGKAIQGGEASRAKVQNADAALRKLTLRSPTRRRGFSAARQTRKVSPRQCLTARLISSPFVSLPSRTCPTSPGSSSSEANRRATICCVGKSTARLARGAGKTCW